MVMASQASHEAQRPNCRGGEHVRRPARSRGHCQGHPPAAQGQKGWGRHPQHPTALLAPSRAPASGTLPTLTSRAQGGGWVLGSKESSFHL